MPPGAERPALRLVIAASLQDRPPEPPPPGHPGVEHWRDTTGAVCAYAYASDGRYWMDWPAVARYTFTADGDTITAWPEAGISQSTIERIFRRAVVPAALQRLGYEVLHASGVRLPGGVVGFCGDPGAGKSTLAAALAQRGFEQWADDTLVIESHQDRAFAVSIPFDSALRPASARHLVGTDGIYQGPVGSASVASAPLIALVLLDRGEQSGGPPAMHRLGANKAFRRLLTHACAFSTRALEDRRAVTEHYLAIAASVPVFELGYASGFAALSSVLDKVMEGLKEAGAAGEVAAR